MDYLGRIFTDCSLLQTNLNTLYFNYWKLKLSRYVFWWAI